MSDATERLADGTTTLDLLYPGAGGPGVVARPFAVAPSASQPRLLVPADAPRAAAAALRAYGGRLNAKARYGALGYRALVQVTRGATLQASQSVHRSDADIEATLSQVIGREVRVAIHLTPARANRKPILQVLDPAGSVPLGFAKLATNSLTTSLLTDEAAALERIAAAPDLSFRVPTVLHDGDFNGRRLLVTSPLPTWERGRLPKPKEIIRAASEIAALEPITESPMRTSAFWSRLHDDIGAISASGSRDRVSQAATRIDTAAGQRVVGFGVGHGDFSPWNMWFTGHRLLIWDWERLSLDVPVGADLVHYKLQDALTRQGQSPRAAADAVLSSAPDPLVAVLHLFALAVRYAKDDQAGAGAEIGDASGWLLPAIDSALPRIST